MGTVHNLVAREIDPHVVRQRKILRCVRETGHSDVAQVLVDLVACLRYGYREADPCLAAINWISENDDVYDALCNERQRWVRDGGQPEIGLRLAAEIQLARMRCDRPASTHAAGLEIEEAIVMGAPDIGQHAAATLAAACRYAWLWEIVEAAHHRSYAARKAEENSRG
jgi:hypothetical protein